MKESLPENRQSSPNEVRARYSANAFAVTAIMFYIFSMLDQRPEASRLELAIGILETFLVGLAKGAEIYIRRSNRR